jgi:DNA-binding CsgD family transcriptional regulator
VAGLLLLFAGRLDEARERLVFVRQRAIDAGDESDLAFFLCWLAWLEVQAGNLAMARAYADEAALVASVTGSKSMRAFAHALSALVSAHRGQIDHARAECGAAAVLAEQTTYPIATRWIAIAACLTELSVDEVAAAWQAAEPLAGWAETHTIGEPVAVSCLPDALEALIGLGGVDRAEALLDRFEACAQQVGRVWALATAARCRGLVLAARGNLKGAADELQRALDIHAHLEMPFEHGRTLLSLGRLERRRKQHKTARVALSDARDIFERIGTPLWAAMARAELERTHLRETPAELTPSERRVAELAGGGMTNRQMAQRLFLSPKTIEANLARAYTKLGIRSRAELGARMAAPPFTFAAPA